VRGLPKTVAEQLAVVSYHVVPAVVVNANAGLMKGDPILLNIQDAQLRVHRIND